MAAVGSTSSRVAASASGVGAKRRKALVVVSVIDNEIVVGEDDNVEEGVESEVTVGNHIGPDGVRGGEKRTVAKLCRTECVGTRTWTW